MTKKKINVCNVNYVRVHGTKSYDWNSKNSSYDDDLTISKNNVCRIKQVDLSIIPSSENIQEGFYQI